MFWNKKNVVGKEVRVDDLQRQIRMLEKEKREAKNDLEDFKAEKKREEESLKHLIKLEKEKEEIKIQKKELELKEKYVDEAKAQLQKHHDNIVDLLKEQSDKISKMIYSEIIKRLPNVNYNIEETRTRK